MENLELQSSNAKVLEHGIGSIEADSSQLERLNELVERLGNGEFHTHTDALVVCDCVDGRCGAERPFGLNSAGGSETVMVADDLTFKRFAEDTDGSTLAQYQKALTHLKDKGQPIGGHTAEGVSAPGSGCGANDKLADIYAFIAANGSIIQDVASDLGVAVDEATHEMIVNNAGSRDQFSDGSELLNILREQPDARVSSLEGKHREVVVVINMRKGTTLDREKLRAAFPDHQAFNVDVWAFENTARAMTENEDEVRQLVAAMVYYNLATACVLAGPNLRVVVLEDEA